MEIKIKSIHFDATEQMKAFIEKKTEKLVKAYEDIQNVEVQLKVVKPAIAMNKEASLNVSVPGSKLFVVDDITADGLAKALAHFGLI